MPAYNAATENKKSYKEISRFFLFAAFSIFTIITSRALFNLEDELAVLYLMTILSASALFIKWSNYNFVVPAIFVMFSAKLYYLFSLDPLIGSDEVNYYGQVIFYDLKSFLNFFWESLISDHILMSAYPAFGIFYMPFYEMFNTESVYLIIVLNSLSLVGIAFLSYKIVDGHMEVSNKKTFLGLLVFGILVSPTLMYWSSGFSKDIFSLFVVMASLYALMEKRFLFFLVFTVYATMIRPYSIAIIFIYYVLYKRNYKMSIVGLIGSFLIVFYQTGVTGIINTFYSVAYLLVAPFPLDFENWSNYFLIVTEVLVICFFLLVSLYIFMNKKETRTFYLISIFSILIYASVLTLVGNEVVSNRNISYEIGTIGDNITRKKLPIIVLLYTVIAYTIINFPRNIKIKS